MTLIWKALQSFSRKEKIIASFLLLIVLFSSYQISRGDKDNTETLGSKAYTEAIVGEIIHLNPVYTEFGQADADISSLIFSGLAKYDSSTDEFQDDIATHILSEDQMTYTFTLKNGVYWHDGTEVTAEDIYFTFAEVIQSEEFNNPILKSNFEGVKITMDNSRTVSFTLNSPNSFFFSGLTVGLLPHHILGEVPVSEIDTHEFNRIPIGTGPYQVLDPYVISPDGSTSVSLSVFQEYYDENPSIELLRFITYQTFEELIANRDSWHGVARVNESMLAEMDLTDLVTYQYELPQYTALFFNTDASNLNQNDERLGISKAIDKTEILEAIDYKVQIDTPLLELNQEEWIHTNSLEEAQGALFDAGWSLEEEETYRTNNSGDTFTLRLVRRDFSADNPNQEFIHSMTAEIIRAQLEEAGVEVLIEAYNVDLLQEILVNRDYDLLLYGQSLGYNQDTFSFWHSSQTTDTGLNLSNYQNPKADFQIESVRESFDLEEKAELLKTLAEIMAEDIPAEFLYTPSYYYVVDTQLTGLDFEKLLRPQDRFSNIVSWIFN